jgi:membrane associated rhomboid family serine protease
MRADATCYRHPDRRASVSCQRCNRPICTECMIEAPIGFQCPEDAKAGKQKVYTSSSLFRGAPARAVLTMTIIAANVAVYLLGVGMGDSGGGGQKLRIDYGLIAGAYLNTGEKIGVVTGEWYRIITSGFLHADLIHIGFNMYLLYVLGQMLEPVIGKVPFGLTYLFALICGSFGALLLSPDSLTVGASGAVFGLMGLAVVVQRSRGINPFDTGIGSLIVLNLVITFAFSGTISLGGHVGGLIGGLVAGWLLVELPRRSRAMPAVIPLLSVAALGVAMFGACLWAASLWDDPFAGRFG